MQSQLLSCIHRHTAHNSFIVKREHLIADCGSLSKRVDAAPIRKVFFIYLLSYRSPTFGNYLKPQSLDVNLQVAFPVLQEMGFFANGNDRCLLS